MPPHNGLTHLKEYDIKDSNVELVGTSIDHRVKYQSATTEPAWNDGKVGKASGMHIWRIENFEVKSIPESQHGTFYEGDSYIVLYSYKVGKEGSEKLGHEIFFWLGSKTSQDEAGTAAYKTVELDEFLGGMATQHREIQSAPSPEFLKLFPRLQIRRGGVESGFRRVEEDPEKPEVFTLLRIFKHPGTGRNDPIVVYEVEPTWQSLDEHDVFVLDKGDKIWVWQGNKCSPMEKAKSAQVVHDLTLAKHIDVEVLAQAESKSRIFVDMLGGKDSAVDKEFRARRPVISTTSEGGDKRGKKLFRLSDSSGKLRFDLVKDGEPVRREDFDTKDAFLLDNGHAIWVWRGAKASRAEKAMWIKFAQQYIRQLQSGDGGGEAYLTPFAAVVEGNESPAFLQVIEV